ncbi:hypothetical protein C6P45_005021 [Maudiozyma exigua]|uniref:Uncharacterized protein n=1 Tax=Maudiozyma exigua TaxID=34358 RepID=A0A9P6WG61_MAUEX|nr:hypothetical protein C6P45_005021 [Kazachstania exigua]
MSGVQGKLSGRVMNMKFMRFAKDDSNSTSNTNDSGNTTRESSPSVRQNSNASSDSRTTSNGFHDNSEWFAKDIKDPQRKKKIVIKKGKKFNKAKVVLADNISVTSLNMQKGSTSIRNNDNNKTAIGRRTFNELGKGQKRKLDQAKGDDNNKEEEDTDDYELDKMFKESMKKRQKSSRS